MDTLIIVIACIVQVIILICFFVLCARIGRIKRFYCPELNRASFSLLLYLGRKDDATRMLFEALSKEEDFIFAFHSNNGVDKARANLKEKYQNYFDALGIELDFDKIGDIVKK